MDIEFLVFISMWIWIGLFFIILRRSASEGRGTGLLRDGSTAFYLLDRGGVYGEKYPGEGEGAVTAPVTYGGRLLKRDEDEEVSAS